jgi:ABC-2 type transport system ATP-binding protein
VENLTKDYGSGRGVFDVSFKIDKGEVFGFLGPNGAGKSTTIRHLMGFSNPQRGTTKIFGKPTFDKYYEILGNVGYIPGEIALPQGLTGWQFIRMMQSLQKKNNEKRLSEMLELFKLGDKELKGETKRMSLGVKRKLAIVAAFMSDPDVLILDEPTSGLDPVMQDVFINFIVEEKQRGKTILLSSHIFTEVDATCDRIAIIKDGKIVSEFVANDLKHSTTKFYKIYFKEADGFARFCDENKKSPILNILDKNKKEKWAFISTDDKNINSVIAILSDYEILAFENHKETLEDYFMKFYKEDKEFGGV